MVKLFENGRFCSALVYNKERDSADVIAINEYALFLHYCTENDQPNFMREPVGFESYVYLGTKNNRAKERGVVVPYSLFEEDTIYILVKDNFVLLDGGKRGKIYAVYEFLERFLGVRFYAPNAYKTPLHKDINIPECEIIYTPKIKFRELYSPYMRWDNAYFIRLRGNLEEYALSCENAGGGVKWAKPKSHTTFGKLMVPEDSETGFAKHPEYYSFRKDKNARVGRHHHEWGFPWGEGEVCWSNPQVVEIMTERLKSWILDEEDSEIFSITQNDWNDHCQCPECEKIAKRYGKDGEPRWSAPMIYAINKIARSIKEWQKTDQRVKDRKILIDTFAYHYSLQPPIGLDMEDNILLRITMHDCCYYHSIEDANCPLNAYFLDAFNGWKNIAKQLYIWDYPSNQTFEVAFDPTFFMIQNNIRFFAENNVVGVFEELENDSRYMIGPFIQVRNYLLAKLLWNPDLDVEAEKKEAIEFFYEEASPYMLEVLKRYKDNVDALQEYHPRCGVMILPEHYSDEFLDIATQLYEVALEKVQKEEVKLRIRREFAYLKFIKMYLHKGKNYHEMQAVLDEMQQLGMHNPKERLFREHFLGGQRDDLFRPEIEVRNRERESAYIAELKK